MTGPFYFNIYQLSLINADESIGLHLFIKEAFKLMFV